MVLTRLFLSFFRSSTSKLLVFSSSFIPLADYHAYFINCRGSQLVSFSIVYSSGSGRKKLFPLLFALLPGKSGPIYTSFFNVIKQFAANANQPIRWKRFVMDFEIASRNALSVVFSDNQLEFWLCYFHFCQCIYRHIQGIKILNQMYNIEGGVMRSFARDLMALAFAPAAWVKDVFLRLLEFYLYHYPTFILQVEVKKLIRYFIKQWLTNASIPIYMWNVFGTGWGRIRTNNALEGYHLLLLIIFNAHSTFWKFLELLKKEFASKYVEYGSVKGGHCDLPLPKPKYVRLEKRCRRLFDLFNALKLHNKTPDHALTHCQEFRDELCQAHSKAENFERPASSSPDVAYMRGDRPSKHEEVQYLQVPRIFRY
jgi:hypothetical protein